MVWARDERELSAVLPTSRRRATRSNAALASAVDHSVPGRALGFTFDRSYRSAMATYNPLGRAGWTASLFTHLQENDITGEVAYHDGSGHVWRFYPQKTGSNGPEVPDGSVDGDFWAVAGAYELLGFPGVYPYHGPLRV